MGAENISEFELDLESSSFKSSVLYHAIKSGRGGSVLSALHRGEDPLACDAQFGTTFLHLVALTCPEHKEDRYLPMVSMRYQRHAYC